MSVLALRPKSLEMKSMLLQTDQTSVAAQIETPAKERRKSRKPLFLDDFVT